MSQKLLIGGFECSRNVSQFNEVFIKKHDEQGNTGYAFEFDVE